MKDCWRRAGVGLPRAKVLLSRRYYFDSFVCISRSLHHKESAPNDGRVTRWSGKQNSNSFQKVASTFLPRDYGKPERANYRSPGFTASRPLAATGGGLRLS